MKRGDLVKIRKDVGTESKGAYLYSSFYLDVSELIIGKIRHKDICYVLDIKIFEFDKRKEQSTKIFVNGIIGWIPKKYLEKIKGIYS